MRRKFGYTVGTVFVLLAIFLPLAASAQGELTLESLAEQFAGLVGRVTAVEERVQALDQLEQRIAALENPPEDVIVRPAGTSCDIVVGRGRMELSPQTTIKFVEEFLADPDLVDVFGVAYYPESNSIEIKFFVYVSDFDHKVMVVEIWQGCEFQGLDMYFADYEGRRIGSP